MKNILPLIISILITFQVVGQDSADNLMEGRAREFFRVLRLSDMEQYKQFMKDNYTQEFLERPIKLQRVESEEGRASSNTNQTLDNLDAKAQMYKQLHNDFGASKISSLKRTDNKIEMVLKSDGLNGNFTFMFVKDKPYLIEGLGVQVEMEN